ncbi:hypothetical protein R9J51_22740 (plasmid) [Novosphingobium rhizosphaerae]
MSGIRDGSGARPGAGKGWKPFVRAVVVPYDKERSATTIMAARDRRTWCANCAKKGRGARRSRC